jgi:beta-glucuronidase
VGEHSGGFTPFQFEITANVHDKGNVIVVKVDDQRKQEFIPTVMTDWWNYGGLTRSVRIIDVPGTFVQDYSIQLEKGSQTHVAGWVRLNGTGRTQKVTVRIPEAGIVRTFTPDANGLARVAFDAKLELWSPERPKLYGVTIESGTDRVPDRIGFRSIEAKGRSLLLNGEPVFLRGVSIHGEAPFTPAASIRRPMRVRCCNGPRMCTATSCGCRTIHTTKS